MAKLTEVTAVIADTLAVKPEWVQSRIEGLKRAGRIAGDDAFATEAADVLCTVMSTDSNNLTGPWHLPFAGGSILRAGHVDPVAPTHPAYSVLNRAFGEQLMLILAERAAQDCLPHGVRQIRVFGHGERLTALLVLAGVPTGSEPGGQFWAWYGYRPWQELREQVTSSEANLSFATSINGQIIDDLVNLLGREPASDWKANNSHLRLVH